MDYSEIMTHAVNAIGKAIRAYGTDVLKRTEGGAVGATAGLGQRVLKKIFQKKDAPQLKDAVDDLAAAPDDPDALAALRLQLRKILNADPELSAEIFEIVREANMSSVISGDRANTAQAVTGIQSSGDSATNTMNVYNYAKHTQQASRPPRQDAAKAARFIAAIPPDAPWLKPMRAGLPLARVAISIADDVWRSERVLNDDAIDFLDPEVREAYRAVVDALTALSSGFSGMFMDIDQTYLEVPREWKGSNRELYYKTLSDLSEARNEFLKQYDAFTNLMNGKDLLP